MAERGRGKIVNICSLQSELARPGIAPYAATKGALKMLTKGMCADWGPYGVQVNGLGPGYIETELTAAARRGPRIQRVGARAAPRPAAGATSEELVGRCCSSSRPRRTSSAGRCCTSTAAS